MEISNDFAIWSQYSQEIIILLSLDYKILAFNPVAEKIYGWHKQKAIGKNFLNLGAQHQLSAAFLERTKEILAGETVRVKAELYEQQYTLEWTVARKLNVDNSPVGFLLVAQDVTRLYKLEQALKKSEESVYGTSQELIEFTELVTGQEIREKSLIEYAKNIYSYLEGIIAAVPGFVYWMNREGIYLGCNDNMATLYNLKSRKDIIGKTYEDLYNKKTGDGYRKIDTQVMFTGKPITIAETLYALDGTICVYLSSKVALRDKFGNVIGLLGNSIDITAQKQNEQFLKEAKERAEAANLAKSEFLSVISHEFRIPLTGILGMAQLIQMQNLKPEKQKEYVQHISTAGAHLLNLINDTLDFAKLEANKFELALAPMDLHALIEEIFTMLRPLAKAKALELLIHFEPDVPHLIWGDKRVLRQIIINLLGNAIKFTEMGNVSIRVECIEQTSDFATLVISVIDTGIGIPEEKQGMIFDHFSQVDASHSRRYGGAGLGLTITKQLVELMSGTISVTSQIAKGSTFRCVIKFALQKEASAQTPWMAYESTVRILIVDDTPRGNVIQRQLSPSNSQVISSNEAFSTLLASYQLSDPYDIVIIDQRLENIDPCELARLILQHDELYQPMLVILIDNGSVNTKNFVKAAGFFECLTKPIQPFALQVALTAAWENWIEQREMRSLSACMPLSHGGTNPMTALNNNDSTHKLKVLLVEDDEIVKIVHNNYLQELDCFVDIASNGKEALEKLNSTYDLVFLDMGLPDIHGIDVIKEFRKRTRGKKQTPVVSLTGYGAESSKQEFMSAGVDDVMVKPVFLEQLEKIIQKYCKEKLQVSEEC